MRQDEILKKVQAGEITIEEAGKLLETTGGQRKGLYCKVSEKGAVSVYGLQRMPVTLYLEQWERLLDFGDTLKEFIKENESKLKRKEKA